MCYIFPILTHLNSTDPVLKINSDSIYMFMNPFFK